MLVVGTARAADGTDRVDGAAAIERLAQPADMDVDRPLVDIDLAAPLIMARRWVRKAVFLAKLSLDPCHSSHRYFAAQRTMRIVRTIFALLIGISVALLPVAGAAAFKLKNSDTEMSDMAASGAMDDCCPPEANPCKGTDGCALMAGCSLSSFGISSVSAATIVYPPLLAGILPQLASDSLESLPGSPPFRPPRV
jgi:hypothetical protein